MLTRTRLLAFVAITFGILTVLSGGTALFGGPESRAAAGNAVPFVLWFNFIAGFAYGAAGLAILMEHRTARPLSIIIAAATVTVFAAFLIHVALGGTYEMRTLFAMLFRIAVWLGIAASLRHPRLAASA